jgi:predicted DNA-binding transcriptional regulator AlpA
MFEQVIPTEAGGVDRDVPIDGASTRQRSEHLRDAFQILSPADLSALIGVDERTLAVWRAQRRGPDAVKLGRSVFYRRADIETWIALNVTPMDRVAVSAT